MRGMRRRTGSLALLVLSLLAALPIVSEAATNAFTFAAFADNRRLSERAPGAFEAVLAEIRDMRLNPEPRFAPVEFVIG